MRSVTVPFISGHVGAIVFFTQLPVDTTWRNGIPNRQKPMQPDLYLHVSGTILFRACVPPKNSFFDMCQGRLNSLCWWSSHFGWSSHLLIQNPMGIYKPYIWLDDPTTGNLSCWPPEGAPSPQLRTQVAQLANIAAHRPSEATIIRNSGLRCVFFSSTKRLSSNEFWLDGQPLKETLMQRHDLHTQQKNKGAGWICFGRNSCGNVNKNRFG